MENIVSDGQSVASSSKDEDSNQKTSDQESMPSPKKQSDEKIEAVASTSEQNDKLLVVPQNSSISETKSNENKSDLKSIEPVLEVVKESDIFDVIKEDSSICNVKNSKSDEKIKECDKATVNDSSSELDLDIIDTVAKSAEPSADQTESVDNKKSTSSAHLITVKEEPTDNTSYNSIVSDVMETFEQSTDNNIPNVKCESIIDKCSKFIKGSENINNQSEFKKDTTQPTIDECSTHTANDKSKHDKSIDTTSLKPDNATKIKSEIVSNEIKLSDDMGEASTTSAKNVVVETKVNNPAIDQSKQDIIMDTTIAINESLEKIELSDDNIQEPIASSATNKNVTNVTVDKIKLYDDKIGEEPATSAKSVVVDTKKDDPAIDQSKQDIIMDATIAINESLEKIELSDDNIHEPKIDRTIAINELLEKIELSDVEMDEPLASSAKIEKENDAVPTKEKEKTEDMIVDEGIDSTIIINDSLENIELSNDDIEKPPTSSVKTEKENDATDIHDKVDPAKDQSQQDIIKDDSIDTTIVINDSLEKNELSDVEIEKPLASSTKTEPIKKKDPSKNQNKPDMIVDESVDTTSTTIENETKIDINESLENIELSDDSIENPKDLSATSDVDNDLANNTVVDNTKIELNTVVAEMRKNIELFDDGNKETSVPSTVETEKEKDSVFKEPNKRVSVDSTPMEVDQNSTEISDKCAEDDILFLKNVSSTLVESLQDTNTNMAIDDDKDSDILIISDHDPLELVKDSSQDLDSSKLSSDDKPTNTNNEGDVIMVVTDTDEEEDEISKQSTIPAEVDDQTNETAEKEIKAVFEYEKKDENKASAVDDIIMLDDDDEVIEEPAAIEIIEKVNDSSEITPAEPINTETPEETSKETPKETEQPAVQLDSKEKPNKMSNNKESSTPQPETLLTEIKEKPSKPKRINRECINFECAKKSIDLVKAHSLMLNFYKAPNKPDKTQYVCSDCFAKSIQNYEELASALVDHQPLLLQNIPKRPEMVEILDSSDEEENSDAENKSNGVADIICTDTLKMVEENLEDVISESLKRIKMDDQIQWNHQILNFKVNENAEALNQIGEELKIMQKMADNMHTRLYRNTSSVIEELPPFDLNTNKHMQMAGPNYPPFGNLVYPPIDKTSLFYAVRQRLLSSWIPCKVTDRVNATYLGVQQKCFKVKFLRLKGMLVKCVPPNQLAYGTAPKTRLRVGIRVIALFITEPTPDSSEVQRASFFPGIIAEQLEEYNKWRYLVFFDDGYAQYVTPDNVRLVCQASVNVWEDVYPESSQFIQNYLTQCRTQRPMVQMKRGQRMVTEWNGKWSYARVLEIDASLVHMFFEDAKRSEWIYRGSTRLSPLYREANAQKTSASWTKRQQTEPYVEYISDNDINKSKSDRRPTTQSATPSVAAAPPAAIRRPSTTIPPKPPVAIEEKRAVAKKSVSSSQPLAPPPPPMPRPTVQHMNNSTIYVDEDNQPKGKVVYYTAKMQLPPKKFSVHDCGPSCLFKVTHNLSSYSPLAKPLLSGWERQILKTRSKKTIAYRAPCGRRLRNIAELHMYLRKTKCSMLNVENFDYDCAIHCLAEYVIDECLLQIRDLSDGKENMVVPCVNYYDKTLPPPCIYSAKRIPTEGVNLNLDPNFMCGCDCEDDCFDKTKCQCWQLTIAGAKFGNPHTPPEQVGYEYKRLPEPVPTGIYECNSRCKCSKTCLNRVAQHPLQIKLQVFKTGNRGWGLRCLNDVPKGSFICVYAGDLLTEHNANEAGDNFGDEYFAELDYIEVVENLKEGYEPDVIDDELDDLDDDYDRRNDDEDDDDDEFVAPLDSTIKTRYNTRTQRKTGGVTKRTLEKSMGGINIADNSDDDEERQPISFVPNSSVSAFDKNNEGGKYKSIRKFYGKNEFCYVMDAKKTGNIGRYFNHSCAPNLFVQNVFVDTHDLRFPWVAFFALSHIRAGSELTWNYNYDVGSVQGKVLYCQCGADTCRGRLL